MDGVSSNESMLYPPSVEPAVPPEAELLLQAELQEASDGPDLELLAPADKAALASLKRERGNAHFQRADYAFAVNSYSIALAITESSSKGEAPGGMDQGRHVTQEAEWVGW